MAAISVVGRYRDSNQIGMKHGDTLVRTLRKIYGSRFAAGFRDEDKLSEVLARIDELSLWKLHKDHNEGALEQKIREA